VVAVAAVSVVIEARMASAAARRTFQPRRPLRRARRAIAGGLDPLQLLAHFGGGIFGVKADDQIDEIGAGEADRLIAICGRQRHWPVCRSERAQRHRKIFLRLDVATGRDVDRGHG
jgi:hypothetical protein